MNLYTIQKSITDLVDNADSATGEIDLVAFENLQMEKRVKQENIAMYCLQLESDTAQIEAEIDRLKKLKQQVENRNKWLSQYLKSSMLVDGIDKLDFHTFTAKIKKNPPKLVVDDVEKISEDFIKILETRLPQKDAIKLALLGGIEVAGCHIEQGDRLEIK